MAKKSDTIEVLLESVRRYMRRSEMICGGESVLLAVSGGVDSVLLLEVMARLAQPLRLKIGVAHFNHNLRETSGRDADFVASLAQSHGIKPFIASGDIRKMADDEGRSVEEVARRERYAFMERIARRHRFDMVATGHTANDNAETLLMNLLRGSGVTGLAGIPPIRRLSGNTYLIRPLLETLRKDVEKYAQMIGLKWMEDETNRSLDYTRNRVRHELIPLLEKFNPAVVPTLNTTAGLMRDFDRYLAGSVETAARVATIGEPVLDERVELDVSQMKHLQPALRGEVIQRVMTENFQALPLSRTAVERALGLLWKETGARASLGGRFEGLRDREKLVLLKHPPVIREVDKTFKAGENVEVFDLTLVTQFVEGKDVRLTANNRIEYIDADSLPEHLVLRSWKEGDRFHPLGMKGEKKVSDFLIDGKVPLDKKREVMVVTDGTNILWVCGMRIDDRFKVGKETKRALKLELRWL